MLYRCCALIVALLLALPALATQRVVSLAPSVSEMMQDLGAQQLLVGMLDSGVPLSGLEHVELVGPLGRIDVEKIIRLQPDLVLNWPGSMGQRQLRQLERSGIRVHTIAVHSMEDLAQQFAVLGGLLERPEQGRQLQLQAQQKLAQMQRDYARPQPLPVFYQLWDKPLYTLGRDQIISDALRYCGAVNIFADVTVAAPQVSLEEVLARQPAVVLLAKPELARSWQALPAMRLLAVPDRGLERPSWQMLAALERLCRALASQTEE